MGKALGTSVVVDNKPGAGASIGLQAMLQAPPMSEPAATRLIGYADGDARRLLNAYENWRYTRHPPSDAAADLSSFADPHGIPGGTTTATSFSRVFLRRTQRP